MKDLRDYSLLRHNTFGIDVRCRRFVEFEDEYELCDFFKSMEDEDRPLLVLGGGSNLLLTHDVERGTVIHSDIHGYGTRESGDDIYLRVGSGETWDDIVAICVANGWHGMENLSLIPGEVGASAVQNIGAYGAEVKDIIFLVEGVDVKTLEHVSFSNDECRYSYRQSIFKNEWKGRFVITHVTYELSRTFRPILDYGNIRNVLEIKGLTNPTAEQLRDVVIEIRRSKLPDPEVEGNAGSFFMNPIVGRKQYEALHKRFPDIRHFTVDADHEKIPAGWMIDQCGWKGRTLGNAGVHDKQALVLVNRGGATGRDVVALSDAIRHDVKNKFGIDIYPEVNII